MAYIEVRSDLINPDENWYIQISSKHGLEPLCPFAASEICPKYFYCLSLKTNKFQSLSSKLTKQFTPKYFDQLWDKWTNETDLWNKLKEKYPSIEYKKQTVSHLQNFFPIQ